MYRIIHEHKKCIGCGACEAVCSKFFELDENGISHLKGSKVEGENEVLEVEDPGCAKEAAEMCPVNIIHVEETKKS